MAFDAIQLAISGLEAFLENAICYLKRSIKLRILAFIALVVSGSSAYAIPCGNRCYEDVSVNSVPVLTSNGTTNPVIYVNPFRPIRAEYTVSNRGSLSNLTNAEFFGTLTGPFEDGLRTFSYRAEPVVDSISGARIEDGDVIFGDSKRIQIDLELRTGNPSTLLSQGPKEALFRPRTTLTEAGDSGGQPFTNPTVPHRDEPNGIPLTVEFVNLPFSVNSPLSAPVDTVEPLKPEGTVEVDLDKPTIVVTHGLQPGISDIQSSDVQFPLKDVVTSIAQQVEGANVFSFQWNEAFVELSSSGLRSAAAFSDNAGRRLATELVDQLGRNYDKSIHMIGHSMGSIVNAFAVDHLAQAGLSDGAFPIDQFTILDAPLRLDALGADVPFVNFTPSLFHKLLEQKFDPFSDPAGRVQYVENYIASDFPFFGDSIEGAAPVGGFSILGVDHLSIDNEFYAKLVSEDQQGLSWTSPVLSDEEFSSRLPPRKWEPPLVSRFSEIGLSISTIDEDPEWTVELGSAGRVIQEFGTNREGLQLVENSPTVVAHSTVIPIEAEFFVFEIGFLDPGDGDWLTLHFGEQLLWSVSGLSFVPARLFEVVVPVVELQGLKGTFYLSLNSTGLANASVFATNFSYAMTAGAGESHLVPEPHGSMTFLVGFLALIVLSKRGALC